MAANYLHGVETVELEDYIQRMYARTRDLVKTQDD